MRKALFALLLLAANSSALADCRPSRDARGSVSAQVICDPQDYANMPVPDAHTYYPDDEDEIISDEERRNIVRRLYKGNRAGNGELASAVKGATTARRFQPRRPQVRQ